MEIKIKIEFDENRSIELTEQEASVLYDRLQVLVKKQPHEFPFIQRDWYYPAITWETTA